MEQETLEKNYQRALDAAARQLSYRALSKESLRGKLLDKGISEDAAEYALAWLCERGLMDDAAFAKSVVCSYQNRGYGPLRIRQELKKRGVQRAEAESAMQEFCADISQMVILLDKRLQGDLSDRKEVNKAVAALQRRGFYWEDIREAIQAYRERLQEEEENV